MWEGLGIHVHVVRPSILQSMLPQLSDALAAQVYEELLPRRNTIVHCFSNGGFLALTSLLQHEQSQYAEHSETAFVDSFAGSIRGIIFDSSPAPINPQTLDRAMKAVFLRQGQNIVESDASLISPALPLYKWYLNLPYINERLGSTWNCWTADAPVSPQLYMFSKADRIVPAHQVQNFMLQQVRASSPP
jgi:hypothetical protein